MAPTLSDQLAARVRSLLRRADHPATAAGTAAGWREQRDQWLDALDPRYSPEFSAAEVRRLIDFLAESGPSASSRVSAAEFSGEVDSLTPELLFSTQ
ncbi:hypothetical protein B0I08_101617 [Glaciihabitans tibetensis]|uniref:Uncharacterized protein n=1 Tax=Glaciihabitans tibetensis TaxID=1266600 RepID=A0A2T0VJS9_9MICO|nr:hypothetical protein [Glaciihabitans tibetensis]PRY70481.1 hypothetical protein B0I08_101617 [Glaciihabitans tibetensis]